MKEGNVDRFRVSWISTVDGRVIDSHAYDADTGCAAMASQVVTWARLIGEDDILTVQAEPAPLFAESQPLGGPVPGVNGSHPPEKTAAGGVKRPFRVSYRWLLSGVTGSRSYGWLDQAMADAHRQVARVAPDGGRCEVWVTDRRTGEELVRLTPETAESAG